MSITNINHNLYSLTCKLKLQKTFYQSLKFQYFIENNLIS